MVVGDEHLHAPRLRGSHAFVAGDAVVDGQQQIGLSLGGQLDDFRGQAIAVFEAIGDQVIHPFQPQGTEALDGHRRGRRAVGIVVADDQQ